MSDKQELEKGINSSTGKVHWARRVPHDSPKLRKEGQTVLVQVCGMNRSVGSGGQHAYLSEVSDATVAISCGRCVRSHGNGGMEVTQTKPAESDQDRDLNKMKVGELRKLAADVGYSSATRMNKPGLVKLLTDNPNGPESAQATRQAGQDMAAANAQSDQDSDKATCPACQQEVSVRPSGRMAPHKYAGERCDGKVVELTDSKPSSGNAAGAQEASTAAKPAKKGAGKPADSTAKPAAAVTANATSKSHAKALRFAASVKESGWTGTMRNAKDRDHCEVTATRGDEVITIEWTDGKARTGGQHYTNPNGTTVVLRNASHCLQVASRSESEAKEAAAKKSAAKVRVGRPRKSKAGSLPSDEVPGANLPFSKDSMPHEIMEAIVGRAIEWSNSISGKVQTALVMPTPKNTIKPDRDGNQVVHFYAPDGQYAVRVSAIRSVGNKQVEVPKTATARAEQAEQRAERTKQSVRRKGVKAGK